MQLNFYILTLLNYSLYMNFIWGYVTMRNLPNWCTCISIYADGYIYMTFGLNEKYDFIFAASGITGSRVSLALSVPDECYSRNVSCTLN